VRYSKQHSFFNGYVRDPGSIVFIIAIVGLFVVSVALLCTVPLVKNDSVNLQQIITKIDHIETKGSVVYLHTNMGVFSVQNDWICNASALDNNVADYDEFQICYKPFSENHKLEGLVWELSDSTGLIYVDEETVRENQMESNRMMAIASWSVVVIYSIVSVCLWYFLSNAPKYPRIAALLVRRQWRNF
jgi:hypothetical protein